MIQDLRAPDRPFTIPPPPEDTRTSLVSNVLAIVGFIIVIVIVIWGLVNLAGISRNWLSSFFGTSGQNLEVTAPESAVSGETFTISWKYNPPVEGRYAFLYQCANKLQFRTPSPAGTLYDIPCGAAYTVSAENNTLSLTPVYSGATSLSVPLSVLFLPSATTSTGSMGSQQASAGQAQGSASVLIELKASTSPEPTITPTPQTPSTQTSSQSKGPKTPADLSVRIISVVPDSGGMTTVTFTISNVGGSASGIYYFTAQLPTASSYTGGYYYGLTGQSGALQGYTYSSPAQASLAPGAHIVNTLRFIQVRPEGGTFSVSVDPSNVVRESNEGNNFASQFVSAAYYGTYNYNYYDQYQYPYTYQQNPYSYQYPYYQNQYPYTQYYPYAQ